MNGNNVSDGIIGDFSLLFKLLFFANILQCVRSTLVSRGGGLRNRKECPEVYPSLLEFELKKQNLSLLMQVSWWSRKTQKLAEEAGSLPLPLPRGHSPLRIFVSLSRCYLGMSPKLPPTVLSLKLAKVVNLSCVSLSLSCVSSLHWTGSSLGRGGSPCCNSLCPYRAKLRDFFSIPDTSNLRKYLLID